MNPSSQPVFGNQPTMSNVASNGDIILTPDRSPKRSKKPIIIAAVALAIVAIMVAIVLSITHSASPRQLKAGFNQYANFVLYGSESDTVITDAYKTGMAYRPTILLFYTNTSDKDQVTDYFKTFKTKLDDFKKSYEENKDSYDHAVASSIDYNLGLADFTYNYYLVKDITPDEIARKYAGDGLDIATGYVNNYYSGFTKSNISESVRYGEAMLAYYKNMLAILDKYVGQECLKKGLNGMATACPSLNLDFTEEEQKNLTEFERMKDDMAKVAEREVSLLEESCFTVAAQLGIREAAN